MSRKIFITIILMLFLLPFGSWYYLQSGLNWRKQAQIIMSGTQPFPEGKWIDHTGRVLSSDMLTEHVTIVSLLSCENKDSIASTLYTFYQQFKDTKKANFIILNECQSGFGIPADSSKVSWFVFNCSDSSTICDSLRMHWPAGKTHALIDRNKVIRAYYEEGTRGQKRILLEHMALLLPRERSDHIELKRGSKE